MSRVPSLQMRQSEMRGRQGVVCLARVEDITRFDSNSFI
jgi:hypothetical protein